MKAIVQHKYGDESTLSLEEVPLRDIKSNEILIKTSYLNISSGDSRVNQLDVPKGLRFLMKVIFGFKGPRNKVRGISGSGTIVKIGSNVSKFKQDDKVYYINSLGASCGAEYVILKENSIVVHVPSKMSLEQAAPLAFGALTAYHFFNENTIKKGDNVLVYGASGAVGTYAVQLAKYYGATVTGVASEKNHSVLLELGCDHVIDYNSTDFTKSTLKYNYVFDTVMKTNKKQVKNVLAANGVYKTTSSPTKESTSRLESINQIIINDGIESYIEHIYDFNEYKKAFAHVYSKHKVGNVIINIRNTTV